MKKLVFVCGILASTLSLGISAVSKYDDFRRATSACNNYEGDLNACSAMMDMNLTISYNCLRGDAEACQIVIDSGVLTSMYPTNANDYLGFGKVYGIAGYHREAIPYFEKAIALGDNEAFLYLGVAYGKLKDYFNAKKYFEIACNKSNGYVTLAQACHNLGDFYFNGQGVRKDYHKAHELWKKACDMKYADSCDNLGVLYFNGDGVSKNPYIAKLYFSKGCVLGNQNSCDNYRILNNQGLQ